MRSALIMAGVALWLTACDEKPAPQKLTAGDLAALKPAPVRSKLTPSQIDRIKQVHATFAEVDTATLEKTIEDFTRDENPESEIAIWEAMASAYGGFVVDHPLTLDGRREAFALVLTRSAAPEEEVLQTSLKVLTTEQLRDLMRRYHAPPAPIRVAK
ncbi:MAG: hypothetical protein QM817_39525 [Archangium sp.]